MTPKFPKTDCNLWRSIIINICDVINFFLAISWLLEYLVRKKWLDRLKRDLHEHRDHFLGADIRPKKSPCNQGNVCHGWKKLKLTSSNFSIFKRWQSLPLLHGLFLALYQLWKKAASELVWIPLDINEINSWITYQENMVGQTNINQLTSWKPWQAKNDLNKRCIVNTLVKNFANWATHSCFSHVTVKAQVTSFRQIFTGNTSDILR